MTIQRATVVAWICASGAYLAGDFIGALIHGRCYAEYGGLESFGLLRVSLPIACCVVHLPVSVWLSKKPRQTIPTSSRSRAERVFIRAKNR